MKIRIAVLVVLMTAGIACTQTSEPNPSQNHVSTTDSSWSPAEYKIARDAFFNGYGTEDAFGRCAFNHIVANNTPSQMVQANATAMIQSALSYCADQL